MSASEFTEEFQRKNKIALRFVRRTERSVSVPNTHAEYYARLTGRLQAQLQNLAVQVPGAAEWMLKQMGEGDG